MTSDAERLAELVVDLGRRLAAAFGDAVSPEAQRHLRNAQREALTALFLIYEEQLGRRAGRAPAPAAEDDEGGWPSDMEELIRRGRLHPEPEQDQADAPAPPRVRKIELD